MAGDRVAKYMTRSAPTDSHPALDSDSLGAGTRSAGLTLLELAVDALLTATTNARRRSHREAVPPSVHRPLIAEIREVITKGAASSCSRAGPAANPEALERIYGASAPTGDGCRPEPHGRPAWERRADDTDPVQRGYSSRRAANAYRLVRVVDLWNPPGRARGKSARSSLAIPTIASRSPDRLPALYAAFVAIPKRGQRAADHSRDPGVFTSTAGQCMFAGSCMRTAAEKSNHAANDCEESPVPAD